MEPGSSFETSPFTIRYEGIHAENGAMDMVLLGKSLEGYGRIFAAAGTFADTGVVVRNTDAMTVTMRVTAPRPGSFVVDGFLTWVNQSALAIGVSVAATAPIMEFILKRLSNQKQGSDIQSVIELLREHLYWSKDQDLRNRALIEKLVEQQLSAARSAVMPISRSASSISVQHEGKELCVWTQADKEVIETKQPKVIQPQQIYEIWITELDIATGAAKVAFSPGATDRLRAKISDPLVSEATNPYAAALYSQSPILVQAKAEIQDNAIVTLHISDVAQQASVG